MTSAGVAAILTSGRTLKQGRAMEYGKFSKEYAEEVSVCEMDAKTLRSLDIPEGSPVLIKSAFGSVVVKSRINRNAASGVVFIPCGPYANMVIDSNTEASGMPDFKGIPVEIFPASSREVLSIENLILKTIGGE